MRLASFKNYFLYHIFVCDGNLTDVILKSAINSLSHDANLRSAINSLLRECTVTDVILNSVSHDANLSSAINSLSRECTVTAMSSSRVKFC
jgi:hypothetical protein